MKKLNAIEFRSDTAKTVSVAGSFNDWCGSAKGHFNPANGQMKHKSKGLWTFPVSGMPSGRHEFKFIINGEWEPGSNRSFHVDEKGHLYDPTGGIFLVELETPSEIRVRMVPHISHAELLPHATFAIKPHGKILSVRIIEGKEGRGDELLLRCQDIDLTASLQLEAHGLSDRPVTRPILFDGLFKHAFISSKQLGVSFENNSTIFRVFSPRARKVTLKLFSGPDQKQPLKEITLSKDSDGVWEISLEGAFWGSYYAYQVEGPTGDGEGFNSDRLWCDPYARVTHFHNGPALLADPAGNPGNGFSGWTDQGWKIPAKRDLIIWECSVRDLSSHPSSGVDAAHRGKYLGLTDTIGKGSGIDHLKQLGVNAVELLPVFEFDDDPPGAYHWGYMSSFFFAPEASYATNPRGAQVSEMKAMIDGLHREGVAVILDVVYNHTGKPDHLMGFDRKYYYRHNGDLTPQNFSGCGNDFNSENPMARRLILESLEYWVREFHVDGFRFDLAELIDDETLHQIDRRLNEIKPGIILIAEPWSFRGTNKGRFKNTNWSSWNDDFRNRVKTAALGKGSSHDLLQVLRGSVDLWCADPFESVNYVESHDDHTLTDSLTENPNHDGSRPTRTDVRRNLFCAAATILSPGIPMLAQGQEMLRSKKGNGNSYNAGDQVNAVDYGLRNKNRAAFAFYRDLIAFRQSQDGELLRRTTSEMCHKVQVVSVNSHLAAGIMWDDLSSTTSAATPGRQMLIMFNPCANQSVVFQPRMVPGVWFLAIAGGKVVSRNSVYSKQISISSGDSDGVPLEVPPLDVQVWIPR